MSIFDDSFVFLSSQSPKIDPTKKKSTKKATKLTLKTTRIRRSSFHNNISNPVNSCTSIVVSSSSSTEDSDLPTNEIKKENHSVIIIESSDSDDCPSTPKLLDDGIKILDELYGVGWRESQKHLLPKSERKQCTQKTILTRNVLCKTETKKRSLTYKNPYLDSEKEKSNNLLRVLNTERVQKSPWTERLKALCDSESESDKENHRIKTKKKLFNNSSDSSSISDIDDIDDRFITDKQNSLKEETLSFLESLSKSIPIKKCNPSARIYRENFKSTREQLIQKLKSIYNTKIFGGKLSNVPVEWSEKMRSTAGFCYCKKKTHGDKSIERSARIVLSTKIVDSADRLRDTLIHEMCHAAAWVIDLVTNGHGPVWQKWTIKARTTFPELPPIKTCHNYVIYTKFTYECTGCGYSFGRHSKSLNLERKRCGHCYGSFRILINKTTKNGETKSVPVTPRNKTTPFADFVKENYKLVKTESLQHGDVMKLLSKQFKELKTKEDIK